MNLLFFGLLYYFVVVRLPSKSEYWDTNLTHIPYHQICHKNGLTYSRFKFLWRHFHCNHATDFDSIQEEVKEIEGDEEEFVVASTEQAGKK